jgi:hypothetical protein
MCAKSLYLVGKADVGRRHVSDRRHGGQSWTSSHRRHEETGEFRSIQVFDFVKHAPDHDTVLKRYETSLDAMANNTPTLHQVKNRYTDRTHRCFVADHTSGKLVRWLRLSEQNFRVDKWNLCRG